jgi:hypothetical protein
MSNFMKISPVGAELFRADRQTDRQTDMTKLTVAFCVFSNTPKSRRTAIVTLGLELREEQENITSAREH